LNNFDITIENDEAPHLIVTGKNGSGKTVLLGAIADFLDAMKDNTHVPSREQVDVEFLHPESILHDYTKGDFIMAFYRAARNTAILEPRNPTKPSLETNGGVRETLTAQLLNFLSDLKIQEALARNENQMQDAEAIKKWFENFEEILCEFFEDSDLKVVFNYKDYTFSVRTMGKSFKFTELSDGFIAILDIVADLILKMQPKGSISEEFNKPGIVLIDEIETHLHLKLQKTILPILTSLFPNIQFLVSTHSPFVLNSIHSATAFDLEHRESISNLTEYSYQSLTEGYFDVSTASDYALNRYNELKRLLDKEILSETERLETKQLVDDFRKIPEAVAPELVGAFQLLEIKYTDKIKALYV
jgi:predicted ATP-binding protein involved in virulence